MSDILRLLITDYTLRTVALGATVLGVTSGALGAFAVLRRQALLGDAVSHATLPGIALAFLLTQSKAPLVLLVGAAIAGWLGTLLVLAVVNNTRIKEDAALGLILSVFFGGGLVLLTLIQKMPIATQAGLDKFLFGQAAALVESDVIAMAVLAVPTLLLTALFWKEFKLLSFDPEYGATLGFKMRTMDILLTSLIVIAIVIGLQTVGVVLMSAMIVAPGAAARQWTDRLSVMVILSALFGAVSGVTGAVISSTMAHLPTGPTIVLVVSVIVVISLAFAPNRGLVWSYLRERRNRSRMRLEAVLGNMGLMARQHGQQTVGHTSSAIGAMSGGRIGIDARLRDLEQDKLVVQDSDGLWALTERGNQKAAEIMQRGVTE
ncbi:metal ABC transporter permease [bacterium]|nr:metal ABC transporter permease [bacterium]